ncbi:PLP-dependent aminotransferase family protein [Intestinimonas massiliensis (ex Afouda et al. 2020)]|uniref:MocR-like pyridoxine biosynthesis transcription factor PdxR n=1 Tax=Intestinimonas massiliensis (ex Afouda et al. 2020) TaxID=1673721 RepID=UPI0010322820|nr:PLP-dependent aminotransferase family protein [Intestinimonas massiliensis (ex Afouda et al. 2020)]
MLTPILDAGDRRPLYEQLYRHIRGEIETGQLKAGARLPSKRALAAHLKVSVVTVEGAYDQLLAEGYLRSEARRGFFVQAGAQEPQPPEPSPSPDLREPVRPAFRWDFSTGGVDTSLFPFSTWAKLMREVLSEQEDRLLSAPHPQGVPELRQAIAGHLYRFRGIRAHPDQIVVGAGSETLIGLLVQLLGRQGAYGVEDPGYGKTHRILASCGARVEPISLDRQGLRVDQLDLRQVRVVHVTPSHHFPLGIIMPAPRRQALLRWASEEPDRYIIEDDYDSEFRFSGKPIPALQSLDGGGRVIYLNTFAKTLAPSLRVSYMVLPPALLEKWRRDFWFYSSTVPSFEQYALARFMERGHFERHLNRSRTRYRARREALLAAARGSGLLEAGSFSGGDAGLHLLLWMDKRWSEADLVERAARAGVGLSPLSAYDLSPTPADRPPALILGYTRIAAQEMAPALEQLKLAWGF